MPDRATALLTLLPVILLAAPGCATAPRARESVGLLLRGGPEAVARARASLPSEPFPVLFQPLELPGAVGAPHVPLLLEDKLALARKGYVYAEFTQCQEALAGEALVPDALAVGQRGTAARVLLWRTACHAGAGMAESALRTARELAVLGLEVPPDVGSVSPEVEGLIARALKEVAGLPTFALQVTSDAPGAALQLDGRPTACTTPCTLEAPEGQHMLRVEAEGREPVVRRVRWGPGETPLSITSPPAAPGLAAAQWSSRYAQSAELDSAASMRLLATALRSPRLVVVNVEPERSQTRFRGVVAVEGEVAARAERTSSADAEPQALEGLLKDLLVKGQIVEPSPPLWKRPAFWLAVGATAAAATTVTAALATRTVRTQVSF